MSRVKCAGSKSVCLVWVFVCSLAWAELGLVSLMPRKDSPRSQVQTLEERNQQAARAMQLLDEAGCAFNYQWLVSQCGGIFFQFFSFFFFPVTKWDRHQKRLIRHQQKNLLGIKQHLIRH